jgi:hypothetical protein
MNKITRLSHNVAVPAFDGGRAKSFTHDLQLVRYREAPRKAPARATLKMVWRTNPASGRPECRWVAEGAAATAEGASCGGFLRQAA